MTLRAFPRPYGTDAPQGDTTDPERRAALAHELPALAPLRLARTTWAHRGCQN